MHKSVDAGPTTLSWLQDTVRGVLQLSGPEEVAARTLRELAATSLQTVGVQYRILQETSVQVEMGELIGDKSIADLALLIDARRQNAA
ncbi:phosphopantetheine-binding protein [Streptomyces bambusae]|uniref:phosphopantetheine-binding protein n=1 Tax=Streptomyces bambusae TaxID=1550616 RepID=UPI001CFF30E5|nr:phosphopantetheine-binding protein [Streptomyces bambusae]MCB5168175.1 phosphopantetheine-binding protein [Streptomyces bambusae]